MTKIDLNTWNEADLDALVEGLKGLAEDEDYGPLANACNESISAIKSLRRRLLFVSRVLSRQRDKRVLEIRQQQSAKSNRLTQLDEHSGAL